MDEKVLTPKEMTLSDQFTMKTLNITDYALMKKAAKGLFDYAFKQNLLTVKNIAIFIGPGNNGGDGVVFGKHLVNNGYLVTLYLVGDPLKRSDSLNQALHDFKKQETIVSINTKRDIQKNTSKFQVHELIIDALFGSGLNKPLQGIFKDVVSFVKRVQKPVISLDVPSGINAYNGINMNESIQADHTLIVQHYKTGNLLFDAPDYHGHHHIVDVGIKTPPFEMNRIKPPSNVSFKTHQKNIHKYDRGTGLIIGGSKALEGALIMASHAALKTGLGLLTAVFDSPDISGKPIPLEVLSYQRKDVKDIKRLLNKKDAYLFGPGLNQGIIYHKDLLKQLIDTGKPIVIDAGGIDYFKKIFNEYDDFSQVVLTPHAGELASFYGVASSHIIADPLKWLKPLTDKKVNVLLKGPCSIVAKHLKQYYLYHPNPALAKGGSGDVLSGLILSFLVHHPVEDAMQYAINLMHKSLNLVLKDIPEESVLPSDVLNYLPITINMLK